MEQIRHPGAGWHFHLLLGGADNLFALRLLPDLGCRSGLGKAGSYPKLLACGRVAAGLVTLVSYLADD
jgi:hypothetical protein